VEKSSPNSAGKCGRYGSSKRCFPLVDILICSRDTCDRTLKLSKIEPNCANIVGDGPLKFWDLDYNTEPTSDTRQSFTAISRGSSEIYAENETSVVVLLTPHLAAHKFYTSAFQQMIFNGTIEIILATY